jgi:superfamily II DNA or RNA helicase
MLLTGREATFVPAPAGEVPAAGHFALWHPGRPAAESGTVGGRDAGHRAGGGRGAGARLELVLPAGASVRTRSVEAHRFELDEAIPMLAALPADADVTASVAAWAVAVKAAVDLVARGRLLPAATPDGVAVWRVGPLDPPDQRLLHDLADALPPEAHALPVRGTGPRRVASPSHLVGQLVDAVADRLVRTAAAPTVGGGPFATRAAGTVDASTTAWLAEGGGGSGDEAHPGLRLQLPDGPEGRFVAVVQLRSRLDPSLVVDAADLWDAPGPVLARLGERADTDLLLALRRGSRIWPPLGRLLDEARPERLVLDDEDVSDLLGEAARDLAGAGIEVLWPTELVSGHLEMRAVVGTPSPAGVVGGSLSLDQLVQFRWEVSVGGETLTQAEMEELAAAKRPLIRVRGQWVLADATAAARLRRPPRRVTEADALVAALSGTLAVDGERVAVQVDGPAADVADRLRAATSEAATDGATLERYGRELPEPPGLVAQLRPYQRRGLAWLAEMADLGLGGCLADDMGLGKTIQVIALHLHRHRSGEAGAPTLVVCPASVLGNWEREVNRFAPSVPVRRYHGGERHLDAVDGDEIVLATYGMVRRDRAALAEVPWGLVIADEAQQVKNPLSRTARELRAIPAGARIALTGTPVENRLSDLWAILDWTTPGLLGSLEGFRERVAIPVERHRDPEATEAFASLVRPFLLRRRKIDPGIAPDLPPKTETDQIVPLTAEQATLYEAMVRETMAQIATAEGIARRGLVLKLLTGLKQICNHPAQYLKQAGPLVGRSGKLEALDDLLDAIVDAGDSVLVFTQYVAMARLLEAHLTVRGLPSVFLHGGVAPRRRDALVDRFQAGEVPVFLLSLKAGGTGLNLTQATHVVHFDRWWNPAVEDQASDRAWRIGQDRPVQVHRLVTEGTIEDRIAKLLDSKRELADAVVGTGEAWLAELSDDDLAALVALQEVA